MSNEAGPVGPLAVVLGYIHDIMDDFPSLREFYLSGKMQYHYLLTPQTIKDLDALFTVRTDIVSESIGFLDNVGFLSLMNYGEPNFIRDGLVNIILTNRTVAKDELVINEDALSSFMYGDYERGKEFLRSNPAILGIFMYFLVASILGISAEE